MQAAWAPSGPLSASPSQPGAAQLFQALGPPLYLHAQTSAWQAAGPAFPRKQAGSTPPCSQNPPGVHYQPGYPSPAAKVRAAPPRLAASIIKTPAF